MTKYIQPTVSSHMRYYSNPLKPITPLWSAWLFHWSYKDLKRVSKRSQYHKMRIRNFGSVRAKKNPLEQILESKTERKIWGKFHR